MPLPTRALKSSMIITSLAITLYPLASIISYVLSRGQPQSTHTPRFGMSGTAIHRLTIDTSPIWNIRVCDIIAIELPCVENVLLVRVSLIRGVEIRSVLNTLRVSTPRILLPESARLLVDRSSWFLRLMWSCVWRQSWVRCVSWHRRQRQHTKSRTHWHSLNSRFDLAGTLPRGHSGAFQGWMKRLRSLKRH